MSASCQGKSPLLCDGDAALRQTTLTSRVWFGCLAASHENAPWLFTRNAPNVGGASLTDRTLVVEEKRTQFEDASIPVTMSNVSSYFSPRSVLIVISVKTSLLVV